MPHLALHQSPEPAGNSFIVWLPLHPAPLAGACKRLGAEDLQRLGRRPQVPLATGPLSSQAASAPSAQPSTGGGERAAHPLLPSLAASRWYSGGRASLVIEHMLCRLACLYSQSNMCSIKN